MEWNKEIAVKFALFHAERMKNVMQTDNEYYVHQSLQFFEKTLTQEKHTTEENIPLSTLIHRILADLTDKKINLYKANSLIQEKIKYCSERDEKLRREKLQISINAGNELFRP